VANIVFDRLVYGLHPYGQPDAGTPESLSKITRDDLVGFHRAYFSPNNAILAIVGDLNADQAFAGAEKAFGDWQRNDAVQVVTPTEPPPAPTQQPAPQPPEVAAQPAPQPPPPTPTEQPAVVPQQPVAMQPVATSPADQGIANNPSPPQTIIQPGANAQPGMDQQTPVNPQPMPVQPQVVQQQRPASAKEAYQLAVRQYKAGDWIAARQNFSWAREMGYKPGWFEKSPEKYLAQMDEKEAHDGVQRGNAQVAGAQPMNQDVSGAGAADRAAQSQQLVAQAETARAAGNLAEAERLYNEAYLLDPNNTAAANGRASLAAGTVASAGMQDPLARRASAAARPRTRPAPRTPARPRRRAPEGAQPPAAGSRRPRAAARAWPPGGAASAAPTSGRAPGTRAGRSGRTRSRSSSCS
jgi:hypothetical protein